LLSFPVSNLGSCTNLSCAPPTPWLGPSDQGRERSAVESDAPVGRQLVLDRRARDLVAEGDRVALCTQHAGGQARLELGELLRRDPLEQPDFGPGS